MVVMWTKEITQEEIERRISEYENTAEEYFQELDSPDKGDEQLAKAQALKDLLEWLNSSND